MTNAQKWVAAFLGVFLLLFIISKVTQKEEEFFEEGENYENTNQQPAKVDGLTLINRIGCTNCHGVDLKGTKLGPNLYGAKEFWTRDNLLNYLRNPQSYNGDERFEAYKKEFKTIMPPYNNIDVKDLGTMADYILSLEE